MNWNTPSGSPAAVPACPESHKPSRHSPPPQVTARPPTRASQSRLHTPILYIVQDDFPGVPDFSYASNPNRAHCKHFTPFPTQVLAITNSNLFDDENAGRENLTHSTRFGVRRWDLGFGAWSFRHLHQTPGFLRNSDFFDFHFPSKSQSARQPTIPRTSIPNRCPSPKKLRNAKARSNRLPS
jgi:hypothetical protein